MNVQQIGNSKVPFLESQIFSFKKIVSYLLIIARGVATLVAVVLDDPTWL